MVYLYVSEIIDTEALLPVYVNEEKITNKLALAEKHTAYSLLYRAAKEIFSVEIDPSLLTKNENGKPVYPDLNFSISHSNGVCAVAISKKNVGIDIEEEIIGERGERIKKRILHPNESPDTDITELWTKKEAAFKLNGGHVFVGKDIDTTAYRIQTTELTYNGRRYVVSIAADEEFELKS